MDRSVPGCRVSVDGRELEPEKRGSLTRIEVDLGVDLFSRCRITFNDPELTLIDGDAFQSGTHVAVALGLGGKLSQVFEGEVVALEPIFRRDLPPSLVVACLDSLHRLGLGEMTRAFNDVDLKEVVNRIAQEHGLSSEAPSTSRQHMMQANVSDAVFLRRLAQQHGQSLRIDGKKMVVGEPPKGAQVELSPGSGLRKFTLKVNVNSQVNEVTVHGWDPKAKREILGKANGQGDVGEGARKYGRGTVSIAGHESAPVDQATAEAMAKSRMRKLAERFVTAAAQVIGDPRLQPGTAVSCSQFGDEIDGVYRIESARHVFSKHGYIVDFRALRVEKKPPARTAKAEAVPPPVEEKVEDDAAAAEQARVMKEAARQGSPLVEECPAARRAVAQMAA